MPQITSLNANVVQQINYIYPPTGKPILLRLLFNENQSVWFMDLDYNNGEVVFNNKMVDTSFNLFEELSNVLPFGVMILSNSLLNPFRLESWVLGDNQLYIESIETINQLEGNAVDF